MKKIDFFATIYYCRPSFVLLGTNRFGTVGVYMFEIIFLALFVVFGILGLRTINAF